MVYINVNQANEFTLNINNNVRDPFPDGDVILTAVHILSDKTVSQTAKIDPPAGDPSYTTFYGNYNARYTEFWINMLLSRETFSYDGEYDVTISNGVQTVYNGIWIATGNSLIEQNPFIQFESDNESNENYIYIEE